MNMLPFTMEHYDAVFALWTECEGVGLSEADSPEGIASYLERNPGMSFVAGEKGDIIGAVLGGHDGRRGYIHHLAVHPSFRRRAVGRGLVERCLQSLRDEGIRKCHVFIFNENTSGVAFWKAMGWTPRNDIGVISKGIDLPQR